MNKHDAYKTLILEFKAVSPSITEAQRTGLLRRGIEEHGLSVDEVVEILDTSGLIIARPISSLENSQYHRISLRETY